MLCWTLLSIDLLFYECVDYTLGFLTMFCQCMLFHQLDRSLFLPPSIPCYSNRLSRYYDSRSDESAAQDHNFKRPAVVPARRHPIHVALSRT